MKKILCPVDYSIASDKLIRYTAELAHNTESKIALVALEPSKRKMRVLAGHEDTQEEVPQVLNNMHDLLTGIYHVPCEIVPSALSTNEYKKLSTLADHYDVLMVGVKGDGSRIKESIHGMNLVRLIRETLVPLMIVPENYAYREVKRLLYAFDYLHEPVPPIMQLQWLASWFKAELRFLSILPRVPTDEEEDKINTIHNSISLQWHSSSKLSFETIVYKDVPKCIEHYWTILQSNDLTILSVNHENALKRMWHKSVVKPLLTCAKHHYLILHK